MPARVGASGGDVPIAVLLHEVTVAHIIPIDTLKALAILVFLDGGTIALTILVDALELRAIGKSHDTLTIGLSVLETAFHGITALLRQFSRNCPVYLSPLAYLKMPEPVRAPFS